MSVDKITPWMRVSSFLGKGPRYLYCYAGWRARRLLSQSRAALEWPGEDELGAALASTKGAGSLQSRLRVHYASRQFPARLCDWTRRDAILRAVPAADQNATIDEADRVLARSFRYRGRRVDFPGKIDWSAKPEGNTDWTWDLNRHHFFIPLGRAYWYTQDERYARGFVELFMDWMAACPPAVQSPQWRSVFEVGVRVANWCWAHALFLPSTALTDEAHTMLLRGVLGLGRFLKVHLERHAWNNHLLLEAKALCMVGLLYPELPGAASWSTEGLQVLGEEIDRQVLADGVHGERSSLYHAIISSELLEHMVVLRLCGRSERDAHFCRALVRVVGLAIFQASITRVDGTWPMLGDASLTDQHVRFNAPLGARVLLDARAISAPPSAEENLAWLLGSLGLEDSLAKPAAREAYTRARHSRPFPNGGYYVLEARAKHAHLHMVFDCGPFGDPTVPGHGHADALSIDVAVGSSHVLVDPGMYSAHLGVRWRNYFRGTSAHNTVVVDGRDQSILDGLRRVYRPARARLVDWASCEAFDVAAGMHLGYLRLKGSITHRREIFFRKPRYWLVVDRLEGKGSHVFDLLFHLHPGVTPKALLDGAFECRGENGQGLTILPLDGRALTPVVIQGLDADASGGPQGWVAFESGVREPAPVVRYRREGRAPVVFATVLFPLVGESTGSPRVEPLAGDDVCGKVCFRDGSSEIIAMRRISSATAILIGRSWRAGELETDADLVSLSLRADGAVESGVLYRGGRIQWAGEVVAWFQARGLPGHFAFSLESERLIIETGGAAPAGSVFGFGGAFAVAKEVLVNGTISRFECEGGTLRVVLGR